MLLPPSMSNLPFTAVPIRGSSLLTKPAAIVQEPQQLGCTELPPLFRQYFSLHFGNTDRAADDGKKKGRVSNDRQGNPNASTTDIDRHSLSVPSSLTIAAPKALILLGRVAPARCCPAQTLFACTTRRKNAVPTFGAHSSRKTAPSLFGAPRPCPMQSATELRRRTHRARITCQMLGSLSALPFAGIVICTEE